VYNDSENPWTHPRLSIQANSPKHSTRAPSFSIAARENTRFEQSSGDRRRTHVASCAARKRYLARSTKARKSIPGREIEPRLVTRPSYLGRQTVGFKAAIWERMAEASATFTLRRAGRPRSTFSSTRANRTTRDNDMNGYVRYLRPLARGLSFARRECAFTSIASRMPESVCVRAAIQTG